MSENDAKRFIAENTNDRRESAESEGAEWCDQCGGTGEQFPMVKCRKCGGVGR